MVAPGHHMVPPLIPDFTSNLRWPKAELRAQCCQTLARRTRRLAHRRNRIACSGDFLFTAKPEFRIALYNFKNGSAALVARKEGRKKLPGPEMETVWRE
jgi:hypothetical protein